MYVLRVVYVHVLFVCLCMCVVIVHVPVLCVHVCGGGVGLFVPQCAHGSQVSVLDFHLV